MKWIETEKFSDTYILIRTLLPLDRESITRLNILVYMMRAKTEKYDTKQKLSMVMNATYGMNVSYGLTGYGKQVSFDVRFKYIRQDYIDKEGYIDQVVDIMDQVVHHPILDESTLKEAKYLLKAKLTSQLDDPDSIAIKHALENAQKDHEIGIQIQGYIDAIDSIQLNEMKELYDMWSCQPKTVYACGHECNQIIDFLKGVDQNFHFENKSSLIQSQNPIYTLESKDISQASLVQVYATNISLQNELYYPLLVMNSMLGQCPMNLLFEEVREKKSYCYSISSNLIRFDGALVIMVGTNRENIEDVQSLINVQLDRLKEARVDESLMRIAQSDLVDMIRLQQDRAASMIEQRFLDDLLGREETNEDRIRKIEEVTLEQVQRVAQSLSLVSVSIVEENEDEL